MPELLMSTSLGHPRTWSPARAQHRKPRRSCLSSGGWSPANRTLSGCAWAAAAATASWWRPCASPSLLSLDRHGLTVSSYLEHGRKTQLRRKTSLKSLATAVDGTASGKNRSFKAEAADFRNPWPAEVTGVEQASKDEIGPVDTETRRLKAEGPASEGRFILYSSEVSQSHGVTYVTHSQGFRLVSFAARWAPAALSVGYVGGVGAVGRSLWLVACRSVVMAAPSVVCLVVVRRV
mmetsp:Transcript_10042/g.33160  ORF Transcript_10042/g.33160 Transcript_10042/m.33160 type:complete len:235 (+) Transcript_10042:332-1036(+)